MGHKPRIIFRLKHCINAPILFTFNTATLTVREGGIGDTNFENACILQAFFVCLP